MMASDENPDRATPAGIKPGHYRPVNPRGCWKTASVMRDGTVYFRDAVDNHESVWSIFAPGEGPKWVTWINEQVAAGTITYEPY